MLLYSNYAVIFYPSRAVTVLLIAAARQHRPALRQWHDGFGLAGAWALLLTGPHVLTVCALALTSASRGIAWSEVSPDPGSAC
jgi:hypothetical protein